jgi:uncharacterized membrane protein YeaQ/YmgE (transglycosylase-associated protein family)
LTISFSWTQLITWGIIGIIAGFAAAWVVRGRGLGTLGNLIVGLIGAVIGGFVFSLLEKRIFPAVLIEPISIALIDIIAATIGAVIVLLIVGIVRRKS